MMRLALLLLIRDLISVSSPSSGGLLWILNHEIRLQSKRNEIPPVYLESWRARGRGGRPSVRQ